YLTKTITKTSSRTARKTIPPATKSGCQFMVRESVKDAETRPKRPHRRVAEYDTANPRVKQMRVSRFGFRFQVSGFRFQVSGSRFKVQGSRRCETRLAFDCLLSTIRESQRSAAPRG